MMKALYLTIRTIVFSAFYFSSCSSPNITSPDMVRAHDDSIRQVMDNKYSSQNDLREDISLLNDLRGKLELEKKELKQQNEKLNSMVEEYGDKKEHEALILKQESLVQSIKMSIAKLNQHINQTQDRVSGLNRDIHNSH